MAKDKITYKKEIINGQEVLIQVIPVGMKNPNAKIENEYEASETLDEFDPVDGDLDNLTTKIKKDHLIEFDEEEINVEDY
jgi:hypothetical protein